MSLTEEVCPLQKACLTEAAFQHAGMRITGGRARGIPLSIGKAGQVRPATDRMREAVFSSLGPRVEGARFVDLFAGSGSYGLEALSRGAVAGQFIEKDPRAVAALRQNLQAVLKSLGAPADIEAVVRPGDALRCPSQPVHDLVFADPPYELVRVELLRVLENAGGLLREGGLLVLEMPADMSAPGGNGWECLRRIGKSGINEPSVLLLERQG